jgi:hypothetical protein
MVDTVGCFGSGIGGSTGDAIGQFFGFFGFSRSAT